MKRWIAYAAGLVLMLLLAKGEFAGTDIAGMEPVGAVRVHLDGGRVTVQTDTGQQGQGDDLNSAVRDMKLTADKEIFLDTADYLLISPGAEEQLPGLRQLLRPACRVCLEIGETDLAAAAAYLDSHIPEITLKDCWKENQPLLVLAVKEGRMYLAQP